jgi:putative transport protein
MTMISDILRQHPELAIFLALALGFYIGKFKYGNFSLGPVLGTLFAGLLIGQLGISVPPAVKIIFFDLFLFATGYKVGPQFFQGLKKDAIPQLTLTVIICVTSLFIAFFIAKLMHYDIGTSAGLLAGAFTESTLIGTASEAIQRLALPSAEKDMLVNNIPIAYAVTYLVGTTTVIWFLPHIAPWLLRINLRDEIRKLENSLLGKSESEPGERIVHEDWDLRAFQVINEKFTGQTVSQLEKLYSAGRIVIERIRHEGSIIETTPDTVIYKDDILAVIARQKDMAENLSTIGTEIFDRELLDFKRTFADIVITKKSVAGKTLTQLREKYSQGIVLYKLIRSGLEMPFNPNTTVNRGDLLQVSGRKYDLEKAAKEIGYLERPSPVTDIIFVALGIVLGGLIGLASIKLFGISITLTTSGGALVMGLFFGWLRSRRPTFGRIPEAALWIFDTLGLTVFIGVVGISAGPGLIPGIIHTGFGILLAGMLVAFIPHLIGLYFGYYILKMNPVILLGAQSGAGTNTTALKSLQDVTCSKLPVLGYTIPYALGNIILTAWGPVIVAMMSR